MGLEKREYITGLDTPLSFGRCEGCTIREIIDDGEAGLIAYYIENLPDFKLSNEAFTYYQRYGNNERY